MTPAFLASGAAGTGAHPHNLEVGVGVDIVDSLIRESLIIDMPGPGGNIGSMVFTVLDSTRGITINQWDRVLFIEHAASRPLLFGGLVQSVKYTAWATADSTRPRMIEVRCVGWGTLLDRRVVGSFVAVNVVGGASVVIQQVVNNHGGVIVGNATDVFSPGSPDTTDYQLSTDNTVLGWTQWLAASLTNQSSPQTYSDPQTLRTTLDFIVNGCQFNVGGAGAVAVGGVYWVDAYGHLYAMWDKTDWKSGYDDDAPVALAETDGAGLVRPQQLDYELSAGDYSTGAFIQSSTAAGQGRYSQGGLMWAGDLDTLVNDDTSLVAADIATRGAAAVAATQGSTVTATATFTDDAPVDIRPGQRLTVTNSAFGLSSQTFLITGVVIRWLTPTVREYEIKFGGKLGVPSLAAETKKSKKKKDK